MQMHLVNFQIFGLGSRIKANYLLVGPVPSVGVFLRDLSPYLCEFPRKLRKTPNGS